MSQTVTLTAIADQLRKWGHEPIHVGYLNTPDIIYPACYYVCTADPHTPRIYALGLVPERRAYYRIEKDPRDWYIACHSPIQGKGKSRRCAIKPEHAEYSPLGPNFVLMPWTHTSPIDDPSESPRPRVAAYFDIAP